MNSYTHRIVRAGRGKITEPVALRFWLRLNNGVLEMAADLEPRRWFECYWSIGEIRKLKGDAAADLLLNAVETAKSSPGFHIEAAKNAVLCACKYPLLGEKGHA